jgi:thiosulfate/3-mercaptopyruvate sulfurtransferase
MECQHCHAGKADFTFNTMDEAHEGLIHDPSVPGESACTECHQEPNFAISACNACHEEEVTATSNSLHTNLWGEINAIEDRCGCSYEGADWKDGFQAKCAGCHTTCGQCHISRPNSVGGGFPIITLKPGSHRFRGTPDMNEQCTACHGSRIGVDFKGEIEGNVKDVHYNKGFKCEFCHKKDEIHGDGTKYEHRYEVAGMPRCERRRTGTQPAVPGLSLPALQELHELPQPRPRGQGRQIRDRPERGAVEDRAEPQPVPG